MKRNQWKIAIVVVLVLAVIAVVVAKNSDKPSDKPLERAAIENEIKENTEDNKAVVDETSMAKKEEKAVEAQQTEDVATVNVESKQDKKEISNTKEVKETAKAKTEKIVEKADTKQAPSKEKDIKKSPAKLPTLIELGAEKCIPCKMMKPILAELEKEYNGKLNVVFYDVWRDPSAAEKYNIQTIPTQVFLDADGKEFFRHVGFYSKEDILATFEEHKIKLD